mmetsp:Transcript_30359/g.88765  ORF Transcript_30359/g.88765 Transcript_30359/m.88765 type:complete len:113 (+) Transcript_30359:331-669(+)
MAAATSHSMLCRCAGIGMRAECARESVALQQRARSTTHRHCTRVALCTSTFDRIAFYLDNAGADGSCERMLPVDQDMMVPCELLVSQDRHSVLRLVQGRVFCLGRFESSLGA